MLSTGSPNGIADGIWIKNKKRSKEKPSYYNGDLLLYYNKGSWFIAINSVTLVKSSSFGSHPLSIHKGEWIDKAEPWYDFRFFLNQNSFENPVLLEDIGADFFLRVKHTRIWFINPHTYEIQHSGAKKSHGIAGKQFCALCKKWISSNNFTFQHVKKLHKIPEVCQTFKELSNILILI